MEEENRQYIGFEAIQACLPDMIYLSKVPKSASCFSIPSCLAFKKVRRLLPSEGHELVDPCNGRHEHQPCRSPGHAQERLSFACCDSNVGAVLVDLVDDSGHYRADNSRGDPQG